MALSDGVVIKTLDEESQDESVSAAVFTPPHVHCNHMRVQMQRGRPCKP